MATKYQRKRKAEARDGRGRVVREEKPAMTRERLLADTEHDPHGAERFVKLLHELRRKRALAALGELEESSNMSVASGVLGEEVLDSEAAMLTTPPRPSGAIKVRLSYEGRSKSIPAEKP